MLYINNLTKKKVPKVPFSKIADHVLGPDYELGLMFVGDTVSKRLNTTYRQKPKPTNILSFPYDKQHGEIFIHLGKTEKESKKYDQDYTYRLTFLFIHGLLHLKGFDHSSKMESEEQKVLKYFHIIDDKKYCHRSGYRNIVDSNSSLRTKKRRS